MIRFIVEVLALMLLPFFAYGVISLIGYCAMKGWHRRLQARWLSLPELVRWVLFLPVLFLSIGLVRAVFLISSLMEPLLWAWSVSRLFLYGGAAALGAAVFFPLQFYVVPRAPIAIGWCLYAGMTLLSILALAGMSVTAWRGLWTFQQWHDLVEVIAWLWVGTHSFCTTRAAWKENSARA